MKMTQCEKLAELFAEFEAAGNAEAAAAIRAAAEAAGCDMTAFSGGTGGGPPGGGG
jgi:hypothetical protein